MAQKKPNRCSKCGAPETWESLKKEIRDLKKKNRELREELGKTKNETSENGPYFTTNSFRHFHRPNCKWIANFDLSNLTRFETHEEAIRAGCRTCKTCSP